MYNEYRVENYSTGGDKVTDSEKLKERISKSGLKLEHIAGQLGISRQALRYKIDGRRDFRAAEMAKLQEILNLSLEEKEQIFFAK